MLEQLVKNGVKGLKNRVYINTPVVHCSCTRFGPIHSTLLHGLHHEWIGATAKSSSAMALEDLLAYLPALTRYQTLGRS